MEEGRIGIDDAYGGVYTLVGESERTHVQGGRRGASHLTESSTGDHAEEYLRLDGARQTKLTRARKAFKSTTEGQIHHPAAGM
jgi:hypothetical protein